MGYGTKVRTGGEKFQAKILKFSGDTWQNLPASSKVLRAAFARLRTGETHKLLAHAWCGSSHPGQGSSRATPPLTSDSFNITEKVPPPQ
jgi:hypothetical protein